LKIKEESFDLTNVPKKNNSSLISNKTLIDVSFDINPVNIGYCQVYPHELQTLGFFSAKRANNPKGKKQIATIICQVWYPPFWVGFLHSGQEITDILNLFNVNLDLKN